MWLKRSMRPAVAHRRRGKGLHPEEVLTHGPRAAPRFRRYSSTGPAAAPPVADRVAARENDDDPSPEIASSQQPRPSPRFALVAVAPVGAGARPRCVPCRAPCCASTIATPRATCSGRCPAQRPLKLDGPINAGVVGATAAAKSGLININEVASRSAAAGSRPRSCTSAPSPVPLSPARSRSIPATRTPPRRSAAGEQGHQRPMVIETQKSTQGVAAPSTARNRASSRPARGTPCATSTNAVNAFTVFPEPPTTTLIVAQRPHRALASSTRRTRCSPRAAPKVTPVACSPTPAAVQPQARHPAAARDERARHRARQLEPVTFEYNADPAEQEVGFIAEDARSYRRTTTARVCRRWTPSRC